MPGWGQSDPTPPGTANGPLALRALWTPLAMRKAAFVGNSMGGAATLGFAVEYPERISHIIVMGSAPVGGVYTMQAAGGMNEGMKF